MHFWSVWRMNTVPSIHVWRSVNQKAYQPKIPSPQQWLQDLGNLHFIHQICPAMMKNTWSVTMRPKQHPDQSIAQHASWPLPGSIWIHCLSFKSTAGNLIWLSMITTPTPWRLAVHFGYWISPTGGNNKRKRTQSTPISLMWHETYSLSCHMVSEWRPVFLLGEKLSAGGSKNPPAWLFAKRWF